MKHPFLSSTKRARTKRARRRGASMVLFLAALPVIIGACGLVIDMGTLYTRRAQAQRAADASALAGAIVSNDNDKTLSDPNANVRPKVWEYAALNGYDYQAPGTTVEIVPEYKADKEDNRYISKVKVRVAREETVFFTPVLEGLLLLMGQREAAANYSRLVSASASATKVVRLKLSLSGQSGIADPNVSPSNQSVFGPDAYYNFGDPWSTKFLNDGVTPNELYEKKGGNHDYAMRVTEEYLQRHGSKLNVEIFDPDSYSANGVNGFDERMSGNSANGPTSPVDTTTVYEIYKRDSAGNLSLVNDNARATYNGDAVAAQSTNEKWVTPPNFQLDIGNSNLGTGDYVIRVKAISGSTENGFLLRAGPPPAEGATPPTDVEWNQLYGDKGGTDLDSVAVPIEAEDHLQMNFTRSGTVKIRLGYVSPTETSGSLGIRHFDLDVGSTSLVYTCDTLPGDSFAGDLGPLGGRDGLWITDNIKLPEGYQGGNWFAEYVAGAQDTSSWELLGGGMGSGYVRLTE